MLFSAICVLLRSFGSGHIHGKQKAAKPYVLLLVAAVIAILTYAYAVWVWIMKGTIYSSTNWDVGVMAFHQCCWQRIWRVKWFHRPGRNDWLNTWDQNTWVVCQKAGCPNICLTGGPTRESDPKVQRSPKRGSMIENAELLSVNPSGLTIGKI